MGSYLADTNLLLRLADPDSEQHPVATTPAWSPSFKRMPLNTW